MQTTENQPIGMFDSGVGGLTVANALRQLLPGEQIIYFGDTAHLPYGDKSAEAIRYYSERISAFLLEQQAKIILIACNTASALAYEQVRDAVHAINPQVEVINVIDPVIEYVNRNEHIKKIGIIGTKGTIKSGTYPLKLIGARPGLEVRSLATPLLVPMIEEGFIYDDISNAIIRAYLSQDVLREIDALILGCTHYPIIKNQIRKFFNFRVQVIDSAQIVAEHVRNVLKNKNIINPATANTHHFFVSDYTETFKIIAGMFFDQDIELKLLDLWKQ